MISKQVGWKGKVRKLLCIRSEALDSVISVCKPALASSAYFTNPVELVDYVRVYQNKLLDSRGDNVAIPYLR